MFAPGPPITVPPMVSVFTQGIGWLTEYVGSAVPASATYESANRAVYLPLTLAAPCVVRRVWWANGATATGGATIEVGVYSDNGYKPGTKLISGSATQSGATSVQFVDVTDTALPAGLYWLAIVSSSATNTTIFRTAVTLVNYDASFRFEQDSASPLPSTATPVETTTTNIWLFGFATTASP